MILRDASLFAQLLEFIPRERFPGLVRKYSAEAYSKGFACWDQFVAMLFCQLGQAHSLREITLGLATALGKLVHLGIASAPKRSTLAYANEHRPWQMYQELFHIVLEKARSLAPRKRLRFKNPLYSLDATVIDLCLKVFDWAHFRRRKGAVKLHLVLDHEGCLPVFAHITDGKTHEVKLAQRLSLPRGAVVAMDRGCNDYALFNEWCNGGVFFVTRMKDNAVYEVVDRPRVSAHPAILRDEHIVLMGARAEQKCPHILRRVVVWDEKNQRELVLLTNHLEFAASTVASIYKERWQIELFFKALKQNLRVKTFVGTSANALKIQIWTALIAILLLKMLQFKSTWGWSLSNLVAMLRLNLFTYRNLWRWIDDPIGQPPLPPQLEQMQFAFA
jgi:hypothetical protein